ncbi:MAG TPA: lactonase family protein [Gemmataceae bacterium]|nr:lactonase family protein [Gemmataceae bacterium]
MAFPRLLTITALGVVLVLCLAAAAEAADKAEKYWVFVGTYTGKDSKGIYRLEFDPATGKLSGAELAAETPSPSFLAVHPSNRFLYAVGETGGGKSSGSVSAFALDPKTGALKFLNRQPSGGAGPCHLVVDKQGKNALVANYGAGSAAALPIGADGKLAEPSAVLKHSGSSVNKQRQEAPHAHSINLDPANKHAYVADLGLDKVMIYRFDSAKGSLDANEPPSAAIPPGSGPRHFAFHPTGKFAYVINELANTVTAMSCDPKTGGLTPTQTVTTLPKDFKGTSYTAEVVVHPSGKFVYGSNRGHNSIAVFRVDEKTGKLTPAGHQGDNIKTPRNFNIDPTGKYLIVANQDAASLVVFRIDPSSGKLEPTGVTARVAMPVCVKFVPKG